MTHSQQDRWDKLNFLTCWDAVSFLAFIFQYLKWGHSPRIITVPAWSFSREEHIQKTINWWDVIYFRHSRALLFAVLFLAPQYQRSVGCSLEMCNLRYCSRTAESGSVLWHDLQVIHMPIKGEEALSRTMQIIKFSCILEWPEQLRNKISRQTKWHFVKFLRQF